MFDSTSDILNEEIINIWNDSLKAIQYLRVITTSCVNTNFYFRIRFKFSAIIVLFLYCTLDVSVYKTDYPGPIFIFQRSLLWPQYLIDHLLTVNIKIIDL